MKKIDLMFPLRFESKVLDQTYEAKIIARYLQKREINSRIYQVYASLSQKNKLKGKIEEIIVMHLVHRAPFLIGIFDSGYAILDKYCLLRKKIYIMNVCIECSPEFHKIFLGQDSPLSEISEFIIYSLEFIIKCLLGIIIIFIIRLLIGITKWMHKLS